MNNIYKSNNLESDDTINIREEIEKYVMHWKWFALGVILALVLAFLYLRYSTPQYNVSAVILIKDDKKSGASAELAAFEDLGILGGTGQNIDNEIEIIKSRRIIGDVIKSLELNILYFTKGRIKETEVYLNAPIKIRFSNKNHYRLDSVFTLTKVSDSKFELFSELGESKGLFSFEESIQSDLGNFKVSERNIEKRFDNNASVKIVVTSLNKLIDSYKKKLSIASVNKKSSVVNLSLNDAVKQKAEHFLDSLVSLYNQDAIYDKNLGANKTRIFIDGRLKLVKNDFDNVNLQLKDFKTINELTDIQAESELGLKSIVDNNKSIIETSIQLSLAKSLYTDLVNNTSPNNLLASNLGLEDVTIAASIGEYNKLVQNKIQLLRTASELNPTVINLTNQITGVKSSLIKSLNNSKKGIELTLEQLNKEGQRIRAKISGVPIQELELGKIKLQQEITSELYSYLLKKKEETAISLAVTVPNAKIIDKAYGSNTPISPKRRIIYLAALLLGGLFPFVIIYLKNLFDTKIHTKKDLEDNLSIPFLGDVPKSEEKSKIVIGADARSSTAEAFRLIRTNLDFILMNKKGKSSTIFITSTTSGEGKSFISINVAASLALSGKKVLLMGMDLRAPKVTEYLGIPDRKGVTNYITNEELSLDDLIFKLEDYDNLDIISSGVVPPNPAELLMTKRVENLFTIVKEEYDYIIVDTAPVNLVTDTLLIAKYADMFMYVARANYLDKRLLAVPQSLYNEKRLPNMAMILNATDPKRSYGYGYGGYGYGYVLIEKPWYKKIFDRS